MWLMVTTSDSIALDSCVVLKNLSVQKKKEKKIDLSYPHILLQTS